MVIYILKADEPLSAKSTFKKQKTARKFELSFKIKWSGLRERGKIT